VLKLKNGLKVTGGCINRSKSKFSIVIGGTFGFLEYRRWKEIREQAEESADEAKEYAGEAKKAAEEAKPIVDRLKKSGRRYNYF
jgi:hypothetical protein